MYVCVCMCVCSEVVIPHLRLGPISIWLATELVAFIEMHLRREQFVLQMSCYITPPSILFLLYKIFIRHLNGHHLSHLWYFLLDKLDRNFIRNSTQQDNLSRTKFHSNNRRQPRSTRLDWRTGTITTKKKLYVHLITANSKR